MAVGRAFNGCPQPTVHWLPSITIDSGEKFNRGCARREGELGFGFDHSVPASPVGLLVYSSLAFLFIYLNHLNPMNHINHIVTWLFSHNSLRAERPQEPCTARGRAGEF